jgi:addiction module HigA family antidote
LVEEFLKPMGISQHRLAKEIGVPAQRMSAIIAGQHAITADTDLRLCKLFGLSNGYWLRAQAAYDAESCYLPSSRAHTLVMPTTPALVAT